jgi:alkylhydroperoxidase/carboxymuconolactone decarboxylase family protein YurZ
VHRPVLRGRWSPRIERQTTEEVKAKTDTPVLDLLGKMTEDSAEYSDLDPRSFMMARMAVLIAVDAPPVSYTVNIGAAKDFDVTVEDLQGLFAAVAPMVGTARVASAAGNVARGLGLAIAIADQEVEATAG